MISDLFAIGLFLLFVIFGLSRPSIALCGVVWVDNFRPQEMSVSFLQGKPMSAFMTVFFLMTLVINAKKLNVPKSFGYHFMVLFFLFWITLTTFFSEYPELAWFKHDSAFKTILAAYFIPFVLTNRKQVEAFIWLCIVAFGTLSFFGGVKTLLGGGGYGTNLIGTFGGSFWSEGSTLATMCVALIPICLLGVRTLLAQQVKLMYLTSYGYAFASLLTVIGTQARAGLVCLAMYALLLFKATNSKAKAVLLAAVVGLAITPFIPDSWYERMETIGSTANATSDASAMGRVVVWRWTFDYVAERPIMGGGFYAYRSNAGVLSHYSKNSEVSIETPYPKAWHNIFIEVLGTQGYVGLLVFLGMISHTLWLNSRLIKRSMPPDDTWKPDFAKALNLSLLIFCTGGLFVNIAFYPWIYYLYGLSIALFHMPGSKKIEPVNTRA